MKNLDLGLQLTVSYLQLSAFHPGALSERERLRVAGCVVAFILELVSRQTAISSDDMLEAIASSGPASADDIRRLYMQLH